MAKIIITLTIMPSSPDVDLSIVQTEAMEHIVEFAGDTETKVEIKPVAFGLKSVNIIFVMDEEKGSTEGLEKKIAQLDSVNSAEVTDVRRTIG